MYALQRYTILHIFTITIRTAKCPTACGTSTILSKKPNVPTGNISDLRTASVCFMQEEPHNIPCILNGGRTQVIGACPVTTGCIEEMSWCENNNNNNDNDNNSNYSSCYSSSSAENAASKTFCARHVYTVVAYSYCCCSSSRCP